MIQTQAQILPLFPVRPADLRAARSVLLVEAPGAIRLLEPTPGQQGVVFTQMRMLGAAMLEQVKPDAIVAPLITVQWDVLDLALELDRLGYRGTLFVMTRPLPRAELVLREVRALCPGIDVRLVETP